MSERKEVILGIKLFREFHSGNSLVLETFKMLSAKTATMPNVLDFNEEILRVLGIPFKLEIFIYKCSLFFLSAADNSSKYSENIN